MTRQETIERGAGVAVWRQIAERLRTEISLDVWKTHDRLPSEAELADRFGVNRHTVRRAVASLAVEGILRANQGRGTFVAQKPISYPISARTPVFRDRFRTGARTRRQTDFSPDGTRR